MTQVFEIPDCFQRCKVEYKLPAGPLSVEERLIPTTEMKGVG